MTLEDRIKEDVETLLRCPSCESVSLALSGTMVCCQTCKNEYPVDPEKSFGVFISKASDSDGKADIQKWWGDLYKQLYEGHEDGIDSAEMERRIDEVEDLFRARQHMAAVEMPLADLDGKSVLEIGPGGGAHSALFKRHGASVVAADITPERALATARKLALIRQGDGRAYQADAENLPFRDGSFDIVYSNGVLHHSEDTDRCITEVLRVLKPGGTAIVMLYSRHSAVFWLNIVPRALISGEMFRWPEPQWIGRLTEGRPQFGDIKNPFTRVYSEREMRRAFNNFEISSLRKASFQFDNFCIPKLTQIRHWVLNFLGRTAHPGGVLLYGKPFMTETRLELWLGRYAGFCWNIVVKKSA